MKDEINDRMKDFYENRTRYYLPRRTFTVIRIDGKSFHTYTRGLNRPFDTGLINDMDETTKFLCESIQGAKFGYVQSDEISILLTDFEKNTTDAWFDGNIQKMASISASMATAKFNELRLVRYTTEMIENLFSNVKKDFALFDSRVFTIPSEDEVINYFVARQQDATRNSISSVAQSLYSHKELNGKSTDQMQEMIFQKAQNWNNYPVGQKRGRVLAKRIKLVPVKQEAYDKSKDKSSFVINENGIFVERNAWTILDPPIFTSSKEFIRDEIFVSKLKEV
jgi:tRNA(His) guanylyltransferase